MRSDQKKLERFTDAQKAGIASGNADRRMRGLPDWETVDYVRVHPNKFPEVSDDPKVAEEFGLDIEEQALSMDQPKPQPAVGQPGGGPRVDQR